MSGSDKRQQRLAAFRTLLEERVVRLNVLWVQLEQGKSREVADGLRRELHTLKGESGLLGFTALTELAHALEDAVSAVLTLDGTPDPQLGDLILDGFDLVGELSAREPDAPAPEANALLAELRAGMQREAPSGQVSEKPIEARSTAEPDEKTGQETSGSVGAGGEVQDESGLIPMPGDTPRKLATYSVRVNPKQLDEIRDIIGELLLTRTRLASSAAALHQQRHGQQSDEDAVMGESFLPAMGTIPERGGEDLLRSIESQLRDDVLRMSSLVSALDEVTRDLRMVSINVIFDRYPVAVRAMSRNLGRQVQLMCKGEAVEADRDVLEALDDPLLHLVRNALVHGIEPPEVRQQAGKPATGTLILDASVSGDVLRLEVRDDGAGIDVEVVKQKAIEQGLIDPGTARTMSERQILRCLFEPGMSTRSTVDYISGRGVGLDVVLKTARNLGGSVEVQTRLGEGTTFQLDVPIRASITSVLLFGVGSGRYALPTNLLSAIEESDDYPITESIDGPAMHYKDGLIPLISLESVLGEVEPPPWTGMRKARILIARHGSMLIGLTGSHSHLQREAVLKPVGTMLRDDKLISAGVALEDGSVALVINPGEVFRVARGISHSGVMDVVALSGSAEDSGQPRRPERSPVVLVAEDSPIVRDLVAEALRVHGLEVITAIDGQEALDKLEEGHEIALLVTDVEMPRLDGLELIAQMRARGGRRIPAVVVSTRGSDADKLAAVKVGADAYLVKSDFTREGLWALVSRFIR